MIKTRETPQRIERYYNSKLETRSISEPEKEDKKYIEGYFIKFDEITELLPSVYESITRESVEYSLSQFKEVKALYNHNMDIVLGRTSNNTLELRVDDTGLYGIIEVNMDDPQAVGTYYRIKRGDIDGCSFGFRIIEEDTKEDEQSLHYNIRKMELLEISPCVFPQYSGTSIKTRAKKIEEFLNRNEDKNNQEEIDYKTKLLNLIGGKSEDEG